MTTSDSGVNKDLGERIASFRNDVSLTQRELADKVGVKETTISYWETGRRGLDWLVKSKRLCRALKCTLNDLVTDENEKPSHEELIRMFESGELEEDVEDSEPFDLNTLDNNVDIGRNIARFRKESGLTQRELADKVGVKETVVSYWETGRRGLDWLVKSKRLCDALRCKLDELVVEKDEKPSYKELLARYLKKKKSEQKVKSKGQGIKT